MAGNPRTVARNDRLASLVSQKAVEMELSAVFAISATLTYSLCRIASPLGKSLGVMDIPSGPSGHKHHASPTPAVGGVILAWIAVITFLTLMPWTAVPGSYGPYVRIVSFAVVLASMVIGFFDDRRHIPAITRLILGTALSSLLLFLVPEFVVRRVAFPSIDFVAETGVLAFPFTVVCLLALKNAVNMADGRNGLLLGMAIIWSIFFIFHAPPSVVPILLSALACLLVLFAFNWRGKLFMGDCGSYGVASFFGILALSLHHNSFGTVRTAEIVILFLIPMLDTARLIFVRLASGHSPMAPDGRHLHHLLDRAVGWTRGWFIYMALVAVPIVVYHFFHNHGVQVIGAASLAYATVVLACSRSVDSQSSNPPVALASVPESAL